MPNGIIHGDLFIDNIFFKNNKLSGIIDFYFAANDYFMYEIAICINALCFDKRKSKFLINKKKVKNLIKNSNKIGISSGASAPEILVDNFINELKNRFTVSIDEVEIIKENVVFKAPKKLN